MKTVLLFATVALIPVGVFAVLRATAVEPPPVEKKPLVQPVWKTKPTPKPEPEPKPEPAMPATSQIKTYRAGEMIDLGSTKFGDKANSRGPIYGNRNQYEMKYRFRPSRFNEAPVQTRRGRNGLMKSETNW